MYWVILFGLFFSSCIQSAKESPDSSEKGASSIHINFHQYILRKASAEPSYSISDAKTVKILITGSDLGNQNFEAPFLEESLEFSNIEPGPNQSIFAELLDENGIVIFTGAIHNVNIVAGESINVTIRCQPNFSSINSTLALGLGNPYGVMSGNVILSNAQISYDSAIHIYSDFGKISIPKIMGDSKYQVEVNLRNASGDLLFHYLSSDSIFIPMGEQFALNIPLDYQKSQSGISFEVEENANIELELTLPNSALRTPEIFDIRFTHFFPEPPVQMGGNSGESISLFNMSSDSLILDSCKVARTRGSNSTTTSYHFENGTVIEPGKSLVLGGAESAIADIQIEMQMVSTKQSLLLVCEYQSRDVLVDSLSYTSEYLPVDSVGSERGLISAKNFNALGQNNIAENWCLIAPENFTGKNPLENCQVP